METTIMNHVSTILPYNCNIVILALWLSFDHTSVATVMNRP